MKKLSLFVSFALALLVIKTNAQEQKSFIAQSTNQLNLPPVTSVASETNSNINIIDVNARALKDFNKQYKSADNVKWYLSGNVTCAAFEKANARHTVVYLKNGRWLHTLINYGPENLDASTASLVKNKYLGFEIRWITEVHEADKVSYFIKVESDKQIKELIVYDGEVWVNKEFKKMPS
jgi:hypothetical protein